MEFVCDMCGRGVHASRTVAGTRCRDCEADDLETDRIALDRVLLDEHEMGRITPLNIED